MTSADPDEKPPSTVDSAQVVVDIVYAHVEGTDLLLDLYLPERAEGPSPAIIWVHGGAWRMGSKEDSPAAGVVDHGYAVASISYRMSYEALFPAQIQDCKAAVRWLRANAERYDLDPERFGAWGASAGGHLAALLGTAGDVVVWDRVGGNREFSSRVQAVCDWFGPTNFLRMSDAPGAMDHDAPDSPESELVGGPIRENRDLVARANPITYIAPGEPPFLIVHGDKDDLVPLNQSELLYEALQAAGVESTLIVLEGAGHGFIGAEGRGDTILQRAKVFFDRQMKRDYSENRTQVFTDHTDQLYGK